MKTWETRNEFEGVQMSYQTTEITQLPAGSEPQFPSGAEPIFDFANHHKYNFVGMVDGGELLDGLCMGWIEDGKQHYRLRIRDERTGHKMIGEPATLDNAINETKMLAELTGEKPSLFHGRRARQCVKRMYDGMFQSAQAAINKLKDDSK